MKTSRLFPALICLIFCLMSSGEEGCRGKGRVVQTVLQTSRCEGSVNGAWDGKTRIRVALRNISPLAQPVYITIQDIRASASVAFLDATKALANLSSWTRSGNWRSIPDPSQVAGVGLMGDTTGPITVTAYNHVELTKSLQCMYSLAGDWSDPKCKFLSTELSSPGILTDATYVVIDHSFSVRICVDEDKGAVIGNVYSQSICVGDNISYSESASFPINGGRPF